MCHMCSVRDHLPTSSSLLRRQPLKRLTSPTFSDEDSNSSMALSSSVSMPASPPVSNRSPPSLHLYVSSSSLSDFSDSETSTSPEWRPGEVKDVGKKKAFGPPKKKPKGKSSIGKSSSSKKLVSKVKEGHVLPKKTKIMEELGGGGAELIATATKSLSSSKCKLVVEEEEKKEEEGEGEGVGRWQQHRAQRKFASNHLPPVRCVDCYHISTCCCCCSCCCLFLICCCLYLFLMCCCFWVGGYGKILHCSPFLL